MSANPANRDQGGHGAEGEGCHGRRAAQRRRRSCGSGQRAVEQAARQQTEHEPQRIARGRSVRGRQRCGEVRQHAGQRRAAAERQSQGLQSHQDGGEHQHRGRQPGKSGGRSEERRGGAGDGAQRRVGREPAQMIGREGGTAQSMPFAVTAGLRPVCIRHDLGEDERPAHADAVHQAARQTGEEQRQRQAGRQGRQTAQSLPAPCGQFGDQFHRRCPLHHKTVSRLT